MPEQASKSTAFSYDRTWADLVALARAHTEIVLVIAGLFLLLPAFALGLYVKPPVPPAEVNAETLRAANEYIANNWHVLLATNVAKCFGEAAILAVLLNTRGQTVATSLSTALALLFPYVVLSLITNFAVFAGLIALIVPGIYLIGRLAVAGPAMFADREANPLNAIARSLSLTRNKGWRVVGLIILVMVVLFVLTSALSSVVTVLLALVVPASAQDAVNALIAALLSATISLVAVLLIAAIYRQLAGAPSPRSGT